MLIVAIVKTVQRLRSPADGGATKANEVPLITIQVHRGQSPVLKTKTLFRPKLDRFAHDVKTVTITA
jgi:hypothetical protein